MTDHTKRRAATIPSQVGPMGLGALLLAAWACGMEQVVVLTGATVVGLILWATRRNFGWLLVGICGGVTAAGAAIIAA